MDATALARWQFAITTVYHFLFVPITIGMSLIVACFHLMWVRTHKPEWLRLTKFFGKLFLINFALGLVTGCLCWRWRDALPPRPPWPVRCRPR